MTRVIAEKQTGSRLIAGTRHPIWDQVERQQYGGKVEWVVVRSLCNGTPDGSVAYATRAAALAAL